MVPRAAAVKCRRINVRPVNIWVARVTEARANIMSKPYALVRVAAAAVLAADFVGPVHAQGIPVFDAQNVAQAISTVAQLEQQVQQEIQLYQSMNGSRGFGALLSNPVLANSLPSNWTERLYGDPERRLRGSHGQRAGAALGKRDLQLRGPERASTSRSASAR